MWPFKKKQEQKSYTTPEVEYPVAGYAKWSEWDSEKATKEGYKSSVAVYACIKRRAEAVASVPFVVESMTSDGWEPVEKTHPLQRLVDRPNPEITPPDFYKLMLTHLDLAGNAYQMKVRDGAGQVRELWPAMPHTVQAATDSKSIVAYYKVGTAQKQVAKDDMCHLKYINPSDLVFGMSPLQAAGKAVDVDNAAQSFQKISMQNRGVPDLHFSFDTPLTPEQYEQAQSRIAENTGINSARKPLVTSKASVTQLSRSPAEMDFIDTRRVSREDVCSAFGVPSALIAEMGDSNLANAETARRVFWQDTVIPLLDDLTESLTHSLASEFGEDMRITYDVSGVPAMQENLTDKLDNAQKLWAMGVPFNIINQHLEMGLDEVEGGNTGYIQSSVIPTSYDFNGSTELSEAAEKALIDAIERK